MNRLVPVMWVVVALIMIAAYAYRAPRYQITEGQRGIIVRLDTRTGDLVAFGLGRDYNEAQAKEPQVPGGLPRIFPLATWEQR